MLMQYLPLVGAALAGVCQAAPSKILSPEVPVDIAIPIEAEVAGRSLAPISFPVNKHWDHETLFSGLIDVDANVNLGLSLPKAAIAGDIAIELGADFLLAPTIKVLLGGVKAYVEVDVAATAGVFQSIELVSSEKLKIAVPGLLEVDIGAAFALDLVLGVSAAVDLEAGFYVSFPEGSFIEINLLTHKIGRHMLDGLVANPLPIAVGAEVDLSAAVELDIGLRLRAELGIGAGLDLLGLDIGAGADLAIWVSLFDYTTTLINTPECALSVVEAFDLNVGIALDINVDVDILALTLAPTASVTLAAAPVATICLPPGGGHIPLPPPIGSGPGNNGPGNNGPGNNGPGNGHGNHGGSKGTASATATGGDKGTATATGGNKATATATATGGSGYPTITRAPTNANQTGLYPTSTGGAGDMITSTIHTTKTYTITSCAASVVNCPAEHTQKIITSTTISTIFTCPASTTSADQGVPTPVTAHTTVTLTTCPVPTTGTFVPPTGKPTPVPTVTICETTPAGKPSTGYPTQPAPVTSPAQSQPTKEVTKPGNGGETSYPVQKPSQSYPVQQPSQSYPAEQPSKSYPVQQPPASYPVGQPTQGYPVTTVPSAPHPSGTGAGYPEKPCPTCVPVAAGAVRVVSQALVGVVAAGAAFALL
ncbi:uncharacterized protein E0L32_001637 [Thyridium curvatum]|uniref:Uncharacterized protein n=1 Tax=Thyridium curvatum TaxID=1093900 RepID=A0A507AP88_9PEZI|nr:uncharacterized protein E0L32_001560 [Thyridium curvatum]XP_030990888.1 uncharacterized protein E0L32_001637 [Thyridium curvatum]TPX09100.1 hypothetical protein E0L32_001560 [Thyridium curvatum]TPX09177.1 hypothetical protein E0L32_001637 [Thyridium curvatum]